MTINADLAASLNRAWSALGAVLKDAFTFYDIKEIAGLAGVDRTRLARARAKGRRWSLEGTADHRSGSGDWPTGLRDEGPRAEPYSGSGCVATSRSDGPVAQVPHSIRLATRGREVDPHRVD